MRMPAVGLLFAAALTLGAGCTAPSLSSFSFLPKDTPSSDIDIAPGASLLLKVATLGPLSVGSKIPTRSVTITNWEPASSVALSWTESFERETDASRQAREEAERTTGVGEESQTLEPVYETVMLNGSVQTDALDDGVRLLLPRAWPERDLDLLGENVTLIWLSRAQYDELVATRHTNVEIGAIDAGLQNAADALEAIKGFVSQLQGAEGSIESGADITEIVANADWGKYIFTYNGRKVSVQTIEAENKFAKYTILANPDNPLILEVSLKALGYGNEALGLLSEDLQVAGYSISSIELASSDETEETTE